MKRINRRKDIKLFILLILLLVITIGYALVSTTLKITGQATITKQTWDVYWGVPTVTEGSVTTTPPTRSEDSGDPANTKLTWSTTLSLPGDYYEFTVDAVNNGSIDAMITGLTPTVSPALPTNPDYIKYSVTYDDGVEPALNHLLAKKTGNTPTTEKYKVKVYYDEAAATASSINGMTGNTTYTFTLNITYGQATDEAIPKPIKEWTLPQGKTANTLSVGDEICSRLSGLEDQCFNFIRYDGNDVVMLAKYNLNVGDNVKGTETFKQDSDVRAQCGTGCTKYGNVAFSYTNYWYDNGLKPEYGSAWKTNDIYDGENYKTAPDFSTTCDSTNCYKTPGYSVAYYVEEYKDILETAGATIKKARLLTYSEAADSSIGCDFLDNKSCTTEGPSAFIINTSFWLGSAETNNRGFVIMTHNYANNYDYSVSSRIGVRPVIVVEKSNL